MQQEASTTSYSKLGSTTISSKASPIRGVVVFAAFLVCVLAGIVVLAVLLGVLIPLYKKGLQYCILIFQHNPKLNTLSLALEARDAWLQVF